MQWIRPKLDVFCILRQPFGPSSQYFTPAIKYTDREQDVFVTNIFIMQAVRSEIGCYGDSPFFRKMTHLKLFQEFRFFKDRKCNIGKSMIDMLKYSRKTGCSNVIKSSNRKSNFHKIMFIGDLFERRAKGTQWWCLGDRCYLMTDIFTSERKCIERCLLKLHSLLMV